MWHSPSFPTHHAPPLTLPTWHKHGEPISENDPNISLIFFFSITYLLESTASFIIENEVCGMKWLKLYFCVYHELLTGCLVPQLGWGWAALWSDTDWSQTLANYHTAGIRAGITPVALHLSISQLPPPSTRAGRFSQHAMLTNIHQGSITRYGHHAGIMNIVIYYLYEYNFYKKRKLDQNNSDISRLPVVVSPNDSRFHKVR